MTRRRWAPLAAGLLLLGACTNQGARACTVMGGYDGIHFDAPELATRTDAQLPLHATFCAGAACQDHAVETLQDTWFFAYNDQLSEIPVDARLTIVDASGAMLLDSTTTLTPELIDINGGGCGPFVWQARAVAGADGNLTAAPAIPG